RSGSRVRQRAPRVDPPASADGRFRPPPKSRGHPNGTMHILRHTHATIASTEGTPLHVVAGRMGDRAETLLATYGHLLPHSDEIAAETVAAVLVDRPLTEPAL